MAEVKKELTVKEIDALATKKAAEAYPKPVSKPKKPAS